MGAQRIKLNRDFCHSLLKLVGLSIQFVCKGFFLSIVDFIDFSKPENACNFSPNLGIFAPRGNELEGIHCPGGIPFTLPE